MSENEKTVDFAEFDLLAHNQEHGTEMKIRHPTKGTNLGPTMTVVSAESTRAKEAQRRLLDRRLKEQRRVPTPEEQEADSNELAASAVVGWSGIVVDGETLEYSHSNVLKFLARFPWVREQIDNHASTRASFLPS